MTSVGVIRTEAGRTVAIGRRQALALAAQVRARRRAGESDALIAEKLKIAPRSLREVLRIATKLGAASAPPPVKEPALAGGMRGAPLKRAPLVGSKNGGVKLRKDGKPDRRAERMRKLNADPDFAAKNAERMRKRHADPDFAAKNAERMRKRHADPEWNPLAALTPAERADYDALVRKGGYSRAAALAAIGVEAGDRRSKGANG